MSEPYSGMDSVTAYRAGRREKVGDFMMEAHERGEACGYDHCQQELCVAARKAAEPNVTQLAFVALAEVYAACPTARDNTAQKMVSLRMGNCSDLMPKHISDRLLTARSSAFCGYEVSEWPLSYAQASRRIGRLHS